MRGDSNISIQSTKAAVVYFSFPTEKLGCLAVICLLCELAQRVAVVVATNCSICIPHLTHLRYFDIDEGARRILNEVMPFSSLNNVSRLTKQFKEIFSWLPQASTTWRLNERRTLDHVALHLVGQIYPQ
jgi:hypothetical protein